MATKYTAEQIIEAVRASSGILADAARMLGCHRATMHSYVNRYSTVRAAVEEEREVLIDLCESKLVEAVKRGDMQAVYFTLKTIGKDRGYSERTELTGKDSEPIQFNVVPRPKEK